MLKFNRLMWIGSTLLSLKSQVIDRGASITHQCCHTSSLVSFIAQIGP